MALGNETIEKLNSRIVGGNRQLKEYDYYSQLAEETLQRNANYQSFISNTEIGRVLNEKLNEIRKVGDKASRDAYRLLKVTDDFLERQKNLNSSIESYRSNRDKSEFVAADDNQSKKETVPSSSNAWNSNGTYSDGAYQPKSEVTSTGGEH